MPLALTSANTKKLYSLDKASSSELPFVTEDIGLLVCELNLDVAKNSHPVWLRQVHGKCFFRVLSSHPFWAWLRGCTVRWFCVRKGDPVPCSWIVALLGLLWALSQCVCWRWINEDILWQRNFTVHHAAVNISTCGSFGAKWAELKCKVWHPKILQRLLISHDKVIAESTSTYSTLNIK